jgi:malyl-CoA/(S)-citramalyl-CoA lyase
MSFTVITPVAPRLNRCELAVPGSSVKMFEKAAATEADIIFLDLEDAVASSDKPQARKNIVQALNDIDWKGKSMSVRINGLDTHYMYRDVIEVVEGAGDKLDLIMIPKVGTPADVYAVDMLLTQIETAKGFKKRIGIEVIIESALGMANVEAIAASSKRLESLHFGVADYSASTQARTTNVGGANPLYTMLSDPDDQGKRHVFWGDQWNFAISRMVVAARANGLRPIDGPYGDFKDPDGYTSAAQRGAALGCEGKWAIHPSQIGPANAVFTPAEKEVAQARRILKAMADAQAEGKGAVALDGRLIDIASIRQAEALVTQADRIAARK